jgi:alpha-ribazole phosphatase/probable phosphoglycerate mutase
MKTTMYLLRHGATEANLAKPAKLLGRKLNPPLAPIGVRQAELTRDFLAARCIERFYSSPMLRAFQTAAIVATPHGIAPEPLEELTECDLGKWEGLDWPTIREQDPEGYEHFMAHPADHGYPGGESFGDVFKRASVALDKLLELHEGQAILVVAHHVVNRTYLASLLGLTPDQGRRVVLETCGISVVVREKQRTAVSTLNAAFHLQGSAA